jgi:hypothetical protein
MADHVLFRDYFSAISNKTVLRYQRGLSHSISKKKKKDYCTLEEERPINCLLEFLVSRSVIC